jgi:hypothetical protein
MSFSKKYVFTHLHLFEWKTMFRVFCELTWMNFFNMELKQYNQLIFNIWLSTSTSLVIVWMVFGVYLHFVVYWYDYIFIPWVLNYFIPSTTCKKPFQ